MSIAIELAERGLLPDFLLRWGIRGLLRQRLRLEKKSTPAAQRKAYDEFLKVLENSAVAEMPEAANEQHYEVPTEFYKQCLGRRFKYSSCYYPTGRESLDEAEEFMLALTSRRANLKDGQEILELGCGWGSLTLWMAEHYPNSRITAVSNSRTQKLHIEEKCREKRLQNVTVITCDVNNLELEKDRFDRVVSVEMFEHVRNYRVLFEKITGWLKPDGKLFVHIFVHGQIPYLFETEGDHNWMGKYFFTGGVMPSDDLFYHFQDGLKITKHWRVSGRHYSRTARHWLEKMDLNREDVIDIFRSNHGSSEARRWYHRWRLFFMACEELWGYRQGQEWWVSHYLFEPAGSARSQEISNSGKKSQPA